MGLWHSADEKVTKCHVRGEVGSAGAKLSLTQAQDRAIDNLIQKDAMGLWRSGSAEDS